jgi:hypothetical protein
MASSQVISDFGVFSAMEVARILFTATLEVVFCVDLLIGHCSLTSHMVKAALGFKA